MYDDYDLDYTYVPEYTYDLDETYDMWVQSFAHTHTQLDEDLDDEYERDTHDYDALAYKHYAWYNLVHLQSPPMFVPSKQRVRITLDLECYDDLTLEDLDWKDLLQLEGDEDVYVTIKDNDPVW